MIAKVSKFNYVSVTIRLLPLLFAAKVLIFACAYPFFNTTDELPNFDTALKHGAGFSYQDTTFTYDSLTLAIAYNIQSPEYLYGEDQNPDFIPLLNLQFKSDYPFYHEFFSQIEHQQAHDSPLYYTMLGRLFYNLPTSWPPLVKVYALRAVNALFACVLMYVVLAFLAMLNFAKPYQIGTGILLICMPQSIFYFINPDLLSCLLTSVYLLNVVWALKSPNYLSYGLLGFTAAIAIMLKATGLVAVLATLGAFFIYPSPTRIYKHLFTAIGVFSGFIIPIVWQRLQADVGVFGTIRKIEVLGWIEKPLSAYFPHILFSYDGLKVFIMRSWSSFWGGESLWEGAPLFGPRSDLFFSCFMLVVLAFFLWQTVVNFRSVNLRQIMRYTSWLILVGYFMFFGILSIRYDFNECVYPSRAFPLFISGRLMLGMLIPVLYAFVDGLTLLFPTPKRAMWVAVLIGAFFLTVESYKSRQLFGSPHNLYHLNTSS